MTELERKLQDAEKQRRRERAEQGRSPAQSTTKSKNKARAVKYPGKGNRSQWKDADGSDKSTDS